ncbi:hypothetical protein B0I35DRAFT_135168 [Stachybotrys elegans]|uniref:Uncharacterized protein n=1 Tax=Stachybotrys elegans TaxID=80388 RepID=A0A8K0T1Y0_9HYPO|nr:hypothetical protein B0I35DRAFT_135168 [Stachybotrys elegans]
MLSMAIVVYVIFFARSQGPGFSDSRHAGALGSLRGCFVQRHRACWGGCYCWPGLFSLVCLHVFVFLWLRDAGKMRSAEASWRWTHSVYKMASSSTSIEGLSFLFHTNTTINTVSLLSLSFFFSFSFLFPCFLCQGLGFSQSCTILTIPIFWSLSPYQNAYSGLFILFHCS